MMKTPKSICRFKKKFFSLEPQISSFSLKFPLTIEQGLGLFQSSWKCSGLEGKFCFFLPERPILQLAVAEGKQKSSQQANLPPDKYFSLGKQSVERLSRAVQPSGGQLHHIHEPDVLHWLQKKKKSLAGDGSILVPSRQWGWTEKWGLHILSPKGQKKRG